MLIRFIGALSIVLLLSACRDIPSDNVSKVPVVPYPAKLVCLGGDWTIGAGLEPEKAYPALMAASLQDRVTVVNAGIKGESVTGAAARIDWILQQRLTTLLLAYGLEGATMEVPVAEQVSAWELLLRKIRNANSALNVIVLDTGIVHRKGRMPRAITDVMKKYEVRIMGFDLPSAAKNPELWQADETLLSAAGQQLLSEQLLKEIEFPAQ